MPTIAQEQANSAEERAEVALRTSGKCDAIPAVLAQPLNQLGGAGHTQSLVGSAGQTHVVAIAILWREERTHW